MEISIVDLTGWSLLSSSIFTSHPLRKKCGDTNSILFLILVLAYAVISWINQDLLWVSLTYELYLFPNFCASLSTTFSNSINRPYVPNGSQKPLTIFKDLTPQNGRGTFCPINSTLKAGGSKPYCSLSKKNTWGVWFFYCLQKKLYGTKWKRKRSTQRSHQDQPR